MEFCKMDRRLPLEKGSGIKRFANREKIVCKEKGRNKRVKRDPEPEPPGKASPRLPMWKLR